MKSSNLIYSTELLTVLTGSLLSGCAILSMASGTERPELAAIQPGQTRGDVERILGPGTLVGKEWEASPGVNCVTHDYYAGRPPSLRYALQAAVMDIFTTGVWELIWLFRPKDPRSPVAQEWGPRFARTSICYDTQNTILGIFNEFDVIPQNGRSGTFAWPPP